MGRERRDQEIFHMYRGRERMAGRGEREKGGRERVIFQDADSGVLLCGFAETEKKVVARNQNLKRAFVSPHLHMRHRFKPFIFVSRGV